APRNVRRLPRRAGAADGAVHRIADLGLDLAADDRRYACAPGIRDLPEPRVRRRRVHDGVAGRERPHPDRQSGNPPRADDDPRGDAARVLGAAPGAARVGVGAEAVQLFVHRTRAVPAVRDRRRQRRLAGDPPRDAGADRQARGRRLRARDDRNPVREAAHFSRARVSRHGLPARGARDAGQSDARQLRSDDAAYPALGAADQSARRRAAAARLCDARTAPGADADQPVRRAGIRARLVDCDRGVRDAPAASLLVGRADTGAQGDAAALAAAPADSEARRQVGRRRPDQHPDDDASGHRPGRVRVQPRAADITACQHGDARDAGDRDGQRDARVPDDDHPPQGDPAGDRFPGDGKRPVFRGDQRDLRHADGRRARHRARRAGGDADTRRLLFPDTRAVRQPRSATPGKAQGMIEILAVLGVPVAGAALLALVGGRERAAEINVGVCLITFAGAVALTVRVIGEGPLLIASKLFFVDSFNVFLIALTAFVGLTTSIFSRPYMRIEQELGHLTPGRLRLYHSMFQLFNFTMLLALSTNNMGLLWVAMEAATLTTVLLISLYRTPASLEAAWKYFILCGVGIAQALFGTILLYFAAEKLLGAGGNALLWTELNSVKGDLEPTVLSLAFVFLLVGYGTKVGLVPLRSEERRVGK